MNNAYRNPFIVVPPLSTCESAFLVFGWGTAPYTVFPIASGSSNGTALENIPVQAEAGVLEWRVDFDAGANITFVVIDAAGTSAFSDFRVVQTQATTGIARCSKTIYTSNTGGSTNVGGIVGGVLGAIVLILLGVLYFYLHRRNRRRKILASRPPTPDSPIMSGPAGVTRAGTFNLPQVAFTESSLDQLRMADAPPEYVPPRRSLEARREGGSMGGDAASEMEESRTSSNGERYGRGDLAAESRVGEGATEARATRDAAGTFSH